MKNTTISLSLQKRIIVVFVGALLLISLFLFVRWSDGKHNTKKNTTTTSTVPIITKDRFEQVVRQVQSMLPQCKQDPSVCFTEVCSKYPFGPNDLRGKAFPPAYIGNNCEPWIRRDIILILDKLLTRDMNVLEFSSGSSTVWLWKRVKSLISIENNVEWSKSVQEAYQSMRSAKESLAKWTYLTIPSTDDPEPKWTMSPTTKNDPNFFNYVTVSLPKELKGNFDVIFVDGRARRACLRRAVHLLKQEGGILVLDNSDRSFYSKDLIVPPWWPVYVAKKEAGIETTLWISTLDPW